MSAPGGAPSPAPRSGSMGPGANGGGMPMSSQPPLSGTPVHQPPTPGQSGPMSQQNLNQIVSCILWGTGICTYWLRPYHNHVQFLVIGLTLYHFAFCISLWGFLFSLLGGSLMAHIVKLGSKLPQRVPGTLERDEMIRGRWTVWWI